MNIVFGEKGFKSRYIGLDKGAPELVYGGSNFALSVDLLGHCSPRDDKCHTYDENVGNNSSHEIPSN